MRHRAGCSILGSLLPSLPAGARRSAERAECVASRGAAGRRPRRADGLLEAVCGLHLAHPELGPKPLLAKLREQQPDLAAGNNTEEGSK